MMNKKLFTYKLVLGCLMLLFLPVQLPADEITVNPHEPTGQVMWGSIEFLYGLGLYTPNDDMNDWKKCYDLIKSIDPQAKITGPEFSRYDGQAYRTFFTFTVQAGRININITDCFTQSAYKVFISPNTLTPMSTTYEFEDGIRMGAADIRHKSWASSGRIVGNIGYNALNWVELAHIFAANAGSVDATVFYTSGENRTMDISVNHGNVQSFDFPFTGLTTTLVSACRH